MNPQLRQLSQMKILIKWLLGGVFFFYACTLNAQVQINEFLAINDTVLQDEDLGYSDWIELKNITSDTVDLTGWYLTDSTNNLTQWAFPSTSIASNSFLVVFASNKDRSVAGSELHTNFKLSGDGEYLALVKPDGETVVSEYAPQFPPQLADVSYGIIGSLTNVTLISDAAECAALVPDDESEGTNWLYSAFDDSLWAQGTTGVGYDRNSDYDSLINIDLQTEMDGINSTVYLRVPFVMPSTSNITALTLRMKFDDGFVAYLNGVKVASSNAPASLLWNSDATGIHDDNEAISFVDFDVYAFAGALVEGENILAIHGLNSPSTSSDMLVLPELECQFYGGAGLSSDLRYFYTPTPGLENLYGSLSEAEPVVFSVLSGIFSSSIAVELFATNSAEKIFYTLDGSEPTEASIEYTTSIAITSTTTIRARAFKTGYALGPINSETYLFLANDSIRTFSSDIPIVVVDNLGGGLIPDSVKQSSFLAFFEPGSDGRTSLTDDFVSGSRAGIRRRGQTSLRDTDDKPNLAVEMWKDGADDDLNITPLGMPSESDWILWGAWNRDLTHIRNPLVFDLSNQTGNYAVRTRFVEVFLNHSGGDLSWDDYAGLYIFEEKIKRDNDRVDVESMTPSDNSEPDISGGYILSIDKEAREQTFLKAPIQGNLACLYPEPVEITQSQIDYIEDYILDFEAQLSNPDPLTGYAKYIDVDSFIDHNLLVMLSRDIDGLRVSTFMSKSRNGKLQKGPLWDFDRSLGSMTGTDKNGDSPEGWSYYIEGPGPEPFQALWWGPLFENADFWQLYIDRWQELRQNDLTDTNVYATIDGMVDEIAEARVRDLLKWDNDPRVGGLGFGPGLDGTQQGEINYLKWWLTARMAWVDDQFIAAPVLSHSGGQILDAVMLTMTAPAETALYYTLDGSDPRAPGGTPSATATIYSGPVAVTPNTIAKTRAWNGAAWTSNPPEDAPWSGLAKAVFIAEQPSLTLTEVHYNPAFPAVVSLYGNDDFEFVELQNTSSETIGLSGYELDGGIEFLFGGGAVDTLAPGDFVVVVRNLAAFATRYDTTGMNIAGEYLGKLSNSGENIQLRFYGVKLFDIAYDDARGWPSATDGGGPSLIPLNSRVEEQGFDILDYPGNWRASTYIGGSPGSVDPEPVPGLLINELIAHTDTGLSPPFDSNDGIELYNPTDASITLDGHWYLSDDLLAPEKWNIPADTEITAGGWVEFDEDDFHAGRTTGFGLNKAGETLILSYRPGSELDRVVDCIAFKGQANGASWGRYPDADAFFQTLEPTAGTANQLAEPGIRIAELMYHPSSNANYNAEEVLEYILLTNMSDHTIALDGLPDTSNTWRFNGGVSYTFSPGVSMASGESLWLVPFDPVLDSSNQTIFCTTYGLDIGTARLIGPYAGDLSNSGERIALERPQASDDPLIPTDISWIIVDEVIWMDEAPWPSAADGSGEPLLRVGSAGNDPHSWMAGGVFGDTAPETSKNTLYVPEGSNTTFDIRLSVAPTATVEVAVTRFSGDMDLTPSPTNLTFTTVTWSNWQTVTVSAAVDSDSVSSSAVIRCSSPSIDRKDILANEIDKDFPEIVVSTNTLRVPEGSTAGFQVKLTGDPVENWTVTTIRSAGDSNIVVFTGGSLVFNSGNWSVYQPVTLSAAEDEDLVSGVATVRCSALSMEDVELIVTEEENDSLQLVLSTGLLTVPESSSNTFGVRLNGDPVTPRTVTVVRTSGDSDIAVSAGNPLVLNSGNWESYQTVTLSAAKDADDQAGEATIQCSSSGLVSQYVMATEADEDDLIPPQLSSVAALSSFTVKVTFSESVDPVEAAEVANYSVDNGVAVRAAVRDATDYSVVRLYVSDLSTGSYRLSVSNVTDLADNLMVPDSEIFSYSEGPVGFFSEPMDSDPGWDISGGEWAFGVPAWGNEDFNGSYGATSPYSGTNVYAYDLTGDYANNIGSAYYLTTPAIDCSGYTNVTLSFQRWLGIERNVYDDANLQVSSNGSTWVTVWENPAETLDDPTWTNVEYDISLTADDQPAIYLRWGLGTTDSSVQHSGWAIDDVTLTGSPTFSSGGADEDSDGDGLPAWWEALYYGGPTNANPSATCSNGINTVRGAYIAGFSPLDRGACFEVYEFRNNVLQWNTTSGRVYSILWTRNLLENFQPLETNLSWTPAIFTDSTHRAEEKIFYKIEVEME